MLRLAGALETASEHPIARAVVTGAAERLGPLPVVSEFGNVAGLGVQGVVEGHAVVVGRPRLLAEWSQRLPAALDTAREPPRPRAARSVAVGWDGRARASSSSRTR